FGTNNGSLIVLDMPSGIELVNMSFGSLWGWGQEPTVAVGNTDNDPGREILFSTKGGLYCIDYETKRVQWNSVGADGSQLTLGTMVLVDPDGDGVDDIVFRNHKRYYRLDNEGKIVHNVSLEVFEDPPHWVDDYLGWPCRLIVDDLDGDGDTEVFISDCGSSMIPEIYKVGHHVWIINLETGVMEYSKEWNNTIFWSDPMLFSHNGSKYVAIGLASYGEGNDTIIIDLDDMSYEMVDVYNREDTSLTFRWISQIPSDNDTILLFGSYNCYAIAWSFQDRKLIWVSPGGTGRANVESPLFVCDIDNDEKYEVLLPVGPVHVLDGRTGELEKRLMINGPNYHGERTTIGDFDGDGFMEICQGLHFWQQETYNIIIIDTDVIVYAIEVPSDGDSMILYASIDNEVPILLRNMTEERLPSNIELFMSNDPCNTFGEFQLFPGNGSHGTTMDSLIIISTYTIENTDEGTFLNLTVIPDWNFSHEGMNDLSVGFTSAMGTPYLTIFKDLFVVERDLELIGDIIISHLEEVLQDGDWLLPSEPLHVSGLDVVYEGTESLHPHRDAFTLDVFDGSVWANLSFTEGEPLEMDLRSPDVDGGFEIVVRIYQVPLGEHGLGRANFTLKVDGTGPHVVDFFPRDSTWFCEPRIPFAILINDEGSGVDPLSIEYCMVRDLNATDRLWQHVTPDETTEVELGLRAQSEYSFSEGSTYILWRFTDHLGNKGSIDHVVNIDLQGIYFHDFSPLGWVATRAVDVTVSVSDRGGSGVNPMSLEYSYSHTDLFSFSEWHTAGVLGDDDRFKIYKKYLGVEGSSNLIRFRGRDNAGNEAISSSIYTVYIDTLPPEISFVDIVNGSIQDPSLKQVLINVTDESSGLSEIVMGSILDVEANEEIGFTLGSIKGSDSPSLFEFIWNRDTGPELNIMVKWWDNANNIAEASIHFFLDQPPVIIDVSPVNGSSFINGTAVNFSVDFNEPNGEEVSIVWLLDGSVVLSTEAIFTNSSIPLGEHHVLVRVEDGRFEVVESFEISIIAGPDVGGPPPDDPGYVTDDNVDFIGWLIVLLIISGLIITVIVLLRRKKNPRIDP
ncbi:MAG: hypothetical protein GQ558_03425, partial [Thermoplasmata archaeon]|nr:hypothetical protein [Thermoplasmata archaeon]